MRIKKLTKLINQMNIDVALIVADMKPFKESEIRDLCKAFKKIREYIK